MNDLASEWTITAACAEDIAEVLVIEAQTNAHSPWSEKTFVESLNQPHYEFWVLKQHNAVRGFCVISVVSGIPAHSPAALVPSAYQDKEAQLQSISISPECQGQRLGQELLTYVIASARVMGVSQMFLEVRESNTRAQNLYEQAGFECLGIRKNYYPIRKGGVQYHEDAKAYRLLL